MNNQEGAAKGSGRACGIPGLMVFCCSIAALLWSSLVSAYPLDKRLYLGWVQQRMEATSTTGMSGQYFAIADIPGFIATVDGYLNGVHVDPEYLSAIAADNPYQVVKNKLANLDPAQGYTQGKGADANKHPSERDAYDGSIILVNLNRLEDGTAMHEAIHAFAFAKKLGDLDLDAHGGPEYLSNNFLDVLGNLRKIDTSLDQVDAAAKQGKYIQRPAGNVYKKLQMLHKRFKGESTQTKTLLRRMGGKADFKGYKEAVRKRIEKAKANFSKTGSKQISMRASDKVDDEMKDLEQAIDRFPEGSTERDELIKAYDRKARQKGYGRKIQVTLHGSAALAREQEIRKRAAKRSVNSKRKNYHAWITIQDKVKVSATPPGKKPKPKP